MIFNEHSELRNKHAFLSPSKAASWISWSGEKLNRAFINSYAADVGTAIHEFAETCIRHKIKLRKTDSRMLYYHIVSHGFPPEVIDIDYTYENVMNYVNDAIGYGMRPEVILYYSRFCFGTADAISYNEKKKFLRIHDLKNGKTPAKIEQLIAYAALFCLEYHIDPNEIETELRIYQQDIIACNPRPEDIKNVMDIIVNDSEELSDNFYMSIK